MADRGEAGWVLAGMSKHWRPQRTRWLSPEAYNALNPAEKRQLWLTRKSQRRKRRLNGPVVGVLVAAAVLGGVVGLTQSRGPVEHAAPSTINWNEVQPVPKPVPDAEDEEWRKRSQEENSPSTSSGRTGGVRVSFGYCKWGGGKNCVVDGDTFYLNGDKVRIAGIDAPETHDYRCGSELALGNQATEMLHSLLNSGAVTMTSIDRDRDVYGRMLRNVAVNGQDVGEAMIAAGVAREYGRGRRPWC